MMSEFQEWCELNRIDRVERVRELSSGQKEGLLVHWRGLFQVPQRQLRDYFGEKVALFFTFANHFT